MATLIVATPGALVRCVGGQVVVEAAGEKIAALPKEQVERALLFGGVGLTTGFLDLAFSRRLPVTFLTQEGSYKGRLDPGGLRDAGGRIAQFAKLADPAWRLETACPLVRAKLAGQRGLLLRHARNHGGPTLKAAADTLFDLFENVERAKTLPKLMGIEGAAARVYFAALPTAFRRPVAMKGRSRRPPRDPANALLSLGYGLLTAELIGGISGVGLDPQIGFFHSPRGRMPALAEDLIEPFRASVADALMLSLFNLGVLSPSDFVTNPETGGVSLTREALAVYFRHFRRRMIATYRTRTGERTSLRRELLSQCAHVRRVYLGEEVFRPFVYQPGGKNREVDLPDRR